MTALGQTPLILNLDDTEAIRYAKTRALTAAGYEVIEAATGADAIRLAHQHGPRLALLDVKLPDMNGLEVCAILKREIPGIVVLQISATYVSSRDRVKGLDSGADAYLAQPVTSEELVAAVGALLRGRRAEDSLRHENESLELQVAKGAQALRTEIEERERIEAALRQSQKLEALGHLTGGIAHDFNNLLMAVLGNLEVIEKRLSQGRTDVREQTGHAMQAARRAAALTQRLLTFARRQPLEFHEVDAAALLQGMEGMIATTLGASISLERDLPPELWTVWCDRHQLENALLNLVINARDAMPEGGALRIAGRNLVVDGDAGAPEREPGEYVRLCVADSGVGMSPEVIERVLDPFFTTKPQGQGTGLGMSMLYSFVGQSNGWVTIDSEPGKGTEVALVLPRAAAQTATSLSAPLTRPSFRGEGQQILVVEDEPLVRDLITAELEEQGYACLQAETPEQALELEAQGAAFEVLITDIGLPGSINGRELARQLIHRRPGLKVIVISGHDPTPAEEGAEAGWIHLAKPFEIDRLTVAINQALAAGP